VIRDELADEVGRTVSADEYRDIVGDRMFRTRRIDRLRPRVSAALVNAQHELAFRKRHVRDAGEKPRSAHRRLARRNRAPPQDGLALQYRCRALQ
jgi:hypothetical protein